jgi:signal transduction histidine kinase
VIASFLRAGKKKLLLFTAGLVVVIALADWHLGTQVSLGLFYIVPMMIASVVLSPLESTALAIICAILRLCFDTPSPMPEPVLRFAFAFLAYMVSSLFVTALIRNRELVIDHLAKVSKEQALRREAEEQLKILVESSPAAVLTVAASGKVLSVNNAANRLFLIPEGQSLTGRLIGEYLPLIRDALQVDHGPGPFRTSAQSQGRREDGEIFQANTWFSSYMALEGLRVAAIVVDSSEEMRDREEEGLRHLMRGNRIAAAAVSHEVRNLCGAIAVVCANLRGKPSNAHDEDLNSLEMLVTGLERIASMELQSKVHETVDAVALRSVLDDLRIVIEPDWRETGGAVIWQTPAELPVVLANRQGLLQAFLNLVQNSHRAVQDSPMRELTVGVTVDGQKAFVRFQDTGTGIRAPERLFQPFQSGANGSGLGLYVSRALVRSYGGELRYESSRTGACFVIELQVVGGA